MNHCMQITEAFKESYSDQPICSLKSKHIIYDFFGDELLKLKLEDGDFLFVYKPWTKNPNPLDDKTSVKKDFTYHVVQSRGIPDIYDRIEFLRKEMCEW